MTDRAPPPPPARPPKTPTSTPKWERVETWAKHLGILRVLVGAVVGAAITLGVGYGRATQFATTLATKDEVSATVRSALIEYESTRWQPYRVQVDRLDHDVRDIQLNTVAQVQRFCWLVRAVNATVKRQHLEVGPMPDDGCAR